MSRRRRDERIRGLAATVLVVTALATAGAAAAQSTEPSSAATRLELISFSQATAASPAVAEVAVVGPIVDMTLQAGLHAAVQSRADLLAAAFEHPPTPVVETWRVADWTGMTLADGAAVSVPVTVPAARAEQAVAGGGLPRPLRLTLLDGDGREVSTLRLFATPAPARTPVSVQDQLPVAVILDLRLPPAHEATGDADFDPVLLNRILGLAQVLNDRLGVALTVDIAPETFDALALIGDDDSAATLSAALQGRQVLASPWTALDLVQWIAAGRGDVVIDGFRQGGRALDWVGAQASSMMSLPQTPTPEVATFVTGSDVGVTGFVTRGPAEPSTVAVTRAFDSRGDAHPVAQSDPGVEMLLAHPDAGLGAHWSLAELSRIAATDASDAVAVFVVANPWPGPSPPTITPAVLALLLDSLVAHPGLQPVTVESLIARSPPEGTAAAVASGQLADPDFAAYLAQRSHAAEQLRAYEALTGADRAPTLAAPLHTLLAVSASRHFDADERDAFVGAVERQVAQGTSGLSLVARDRITITRRASDLPVTIDNAQPIPLTVALELTSPKIEFPQGSRAVVELAPGRNYLTVPISATDAGVTAVSVTVTTPDDRSKIILSTGTLEVRYIAVAGLGAMILAAAAAVVAIWWLRTLRARPLTAESET